MLVQLEHLHPHRNAWAMHLKVLSVLILLTPGMRLRTAVLVPGDPGLLQCSDKDSVSARGKAWHLAPQDLKSEEGMK